MLPTRRIEAIGLFGTVHAFEKEVGATDATVIKSDPIFYIRATPSYYIAPYYEGCIDETIDAPPSIW